MLLYLVQHGTAKSKDEDPQRFLTDTGKTTSEAIARLFSRIQPEIHVIWHSGKPRARQTAEIFAEALGIPQRLLEHTNLAPDDPPGPVVKELSSSHHDIMVVGHLPFLSRLAGSLLTGGPDREPVAFTNSGIVCLERSETAWTVNWVLTPAIAAALVPEEA